MYFSAYDLTHLSQTPFQSSGLDTSRTTRHHGLVDRVYRDRNRLGSPHRRPLSVDKHGRQISFAVWAGRESLPSTRVTSCGFYSSLLPPLLTCQQSCFPSPCSYCHLLFWAVICSVNTSCSECAFAFTHGSVLRVGNSAHWAERDWAPLMEETKQFLWSRVSLQNWADPNQNNALQFSVPFITSWFIRLTSARRCFLLLVVRWISFLLLTGFKCGVVTLVWWGRGL